MLWIVPHLSAGNAVQEVRERLLLITVLWLVGGIFSSNSVLRLQITANSVTVHKHVFASVRSLSVVSFIMFIEGFATFSSHTLDR